MSFFFAYLIKFSISLAAIYLFYRFVLRKLTFYSWNRWYLLGYSFLSFFIAAINITPLLQQNQLADNKTIQWVPSLDLYTGTKLNGPVGNISTAWSAWDWTLLILIAGVIILLVRLFIQYLSFLRIRSKAQLLSQNGMRLYQVEADIIPFSFGNSIFINQHLHTEEELREIIRHEFVHVKQRHSLDILWSELLCILNWYNPFAWLLRHAIRQNLEFIADHKVISHGVNRKEYQYLLLKVIGNKHFSIASKFNFSSLKKRIAMMNKMKSAGVHVLKFLFILPLVAVLLVAFRQGKNDQQQPEKQFVKTQGEKMRIDTVPFVTTPNSKGYLVDVIGVNGECTVVVKDKKGKEVERVTLNKWKEDKKYEEQYGEILPPPPPPPPIPPVEPVAPVEPTQPVPPTEPIAPVAPLSPLDCPITSLTTPVASINNGINLRGISREYEITDKKAWLKLLDGTIEEYDLTNKKERAAFENKYGKIINVNTNVNTTVKTITNTNINSDLNTTITFASPTASVGNGLTTSVAPALISNDGIISVATPTPRPDGLGTTTIIDPGGHMITGKEDIIITITSKTTRQELDKFITDMKAKGVTLSYDQIEYDGKGRLVVLTGTMKSGGSSSNFVATDFDKLILAMVKVGDKTWFKVSVKEKEVI